MNRGVLQLQLQSSPLQQMVWNMNNLRPTSQQQQQQLSPPFLLPPPSFFPQLYSPSSLPLQLEELPESWSQLLMGGLVGEEEKCGLMSHDLQFKKWENWEEQLLVHQAPSEIKQEHSSSANGYIYGHGNNAEFQQAPKPTWSPMMPAASSPKSCVTSLSSNNILDFSSKKADGKHSPPHHSSELNSSANGGALKKARTNKTSSTQSTFKVRKEKLGDRITALHQLVSPFGKTDTASVLLEAIGYIRFLHSQIEALSLPYLGSGSGNKRQQQQPAQGERNCLFPEDPGQLLNDNCMKRKAASDLQDSHEEPKKDLRSRGLCLVPISCTMQVGSETGADYWAPALGGGCR
ncbi:hypothetical protein NMG60_11021886 [Bertholletia excelsa]